MNSISVAQLGARMHYAVPRILHEHGLLERFYTDLHSKNAVLDVVRKLPSFLFSGSVESLLDRVPRGVPRRKITSFPRLGLAYFFRRKTARTGQALQNAHLWMGQAFNQKVIRSEGKSPDGYYVFNTAGLEILEHARQTNRTGILEQTIAPLEVEKRILKEEARRHPEWTDTRNFGRYNHVRMVEREQREWEEADQILCGSAFVADGIAKCGGPREKCTIVPYGVELKPVVRSKSLGSLEKEADRPLRVLTVGTVGLRKGIPYVYRAAKELEEAAQFRVVGPVNIPPPAVAKLKKCAEVTGSVPRTEVPDHYSWADVFLLPSLCEGSATVCYEALRHGLPVVTTPNAGSIVRDEKEGFIVPIRDGRATAEALKRFIEDRALLQSMSESAKMRARKGSLKAYANRLLDALPT